MSPVLANVAMHLAPEIARYAGLYDLSPTHRSYGEPQDAGTLTFPQAAKFGGLATSVVLATTLTGYALDKQITKSLGLSEGWGPVVGAAGGLAVTNAVAGLAQGVPASAGYLFGSAGALVPTAIAAYAFGRKPQDKGTAYFLAGLAAATVVFGVARGVVKRA